MSIWPFNRKKDQEQSIVAGEVQDYYQSERRERKGMAWLLAIATFLVTLLAVLILFYGGKWAYNKIRGDDSNTADVVQEQTPEQETQNANESEGTSQDDDQTSSTSDSGNVNGANDSPQTSSTSTSTPSPTTTPTTGPSSDELPNTGPDQDL